jgi:hypothetical protein
MGTRSVYDLELITEFLGAVSVGGFSVSNIKKSKSSPATVKSAGLKVNTGSLLE